MYSSNQVLINYLYHASVDSIRHGKLRLNSKLDKFEAYVKYFGKSKSNGLK